MSLLACVPVLAAEQLSAPAFADDSLCGRLNAPASTIRNPGGARPWAAKQIYYPVRAALQAIASSLCFEVFWIPAYYRLWLCGQEWLFGEWDVRQRFVGFRTPLGYEYIPAWAQQSAQARLPCRMAMASPAMSSLCKDDRCTQADARVSG